MTATAAELTDTRIAVIGHAREVLDRAVSECRAWRGGEENRFKVTTAAAGLEAALRTWDRAQGGSEKDNAVALVGHWTSQAVAVVKGWMGEEAAEYVSCGEEWVWE